MSGRWPAALAAALRGWLARRRPRSDAGGAVPWLAEAERLKGLREVPGPGSNATITGWAKERGGWIETFYTGDDIPWCGLFVAHCMHVARLPSPKNPLAALAWSEWGRALSSPAPGAVLVFKRPGGGHVGFYVGEDAEALHVLGGNQSDAVCVTRIARERLIAVRWPAGVGIARAAVVHRTATGALSMNEN